MNSSIGNFFIPIFFKCLRKDQKNTPLVVETTTLSDGLASSLEVLKRKHSFPEVHNIPVYPRGRCIACVLN